jgi:hypothetical protein
MSLEWQGYLRGRLSGAVLPNGTYGDEPITDIVVHELRVYSPEIDGLILEVLRLSGTEETTSFRRTLPYPREVTPTELAALEERLRALVADLRATAHERGWEVPESGDYSA